MIPPIFLSQNVAAIAPERRYSIPKPRGFFDRLELSPVFERCPREPRQGDAKQTEEHMQTRIVSFRAISNYVARVPSVFFV